MSGIVIVLFLLAVFLGIVLIKKPQSEFALGCLKGARHFFESLILNSIAELR